MNTRAVAFDARPLTDAVDPAEARRFARELRAQGRLAGGNGSPAQRVVIGVAVVMLFVLLSVGAGAIATLVTARSSFGTGSIVPALVVAGIGAFLVWLVVRGGSTQAQRWLRLDRFARANGMTFVPRIPDPHLPGTIFNRGSMRLGSDLVRGAHPRFVEFANYEYTTGTGDSRRRHRWGYVAVKLDVPLPHIILDAIGNNGLFGGSNLPSAYDRGQRLSLEGDFDQYFALYCPSGYERDALYLFTPDIMAQFVDHAAQLDVEIVDDWLFLYAPRDLSTLDPATWGWLFTVVASLLDKLSQWSRWRDDRLAGFPTGAAGVAPPVTGAAAGNAASGIHDPRLAEPAAPFTPPPGVAPPGRRLKGRFPWVALVVVAAVVFSWVISVAGGILFGR